MTKNKTTNNNENMNKNKRGTQAKERTQKCKKYDENRKWRKLIRMWPKITNKNKSEHRKDQKNMIKIGKKETKEYD